MIALITGITISIVHMGKTTAQKGAHVVKDGKNHKDVMLLLLGIPPKLIIQCKPIRCHNNSYMLAGKTFTWNSKWSSPGNVPQTVFSYMLFFLEFCVSARLIIEL